MPKHQKNAKKRGMMGMSNQLSGITHFSDITALTGGDGGQVSERETSLGRRPRKECEAPSRIRMGVTEHISVQHEWDTFGLILGVAAVSFSYRMVITLDPRKRRNS